MNHITITGVIFVPAIPNHERCPHCGSCKHCGASPQAPPPLPYYVGTPIPAPYKVGEPIWMVDNTYMPSVTSTLTNGSVIYS